MQNKVKLILIFVFSAFLVKANTYYMPFKMINKLEVKPPKTYYFPNGLIYEYEKDGVKEELWLYVNPKTKQILYVPNDDMIKGVISFPNGTYKIFGKTEKGIDTILTQYVSNILIDNKIPSATKKLVSTKVISQVNIQQKPIKCQGYYIKYLKMEGGETIYTTTQIPINSKQIYGFCRLNGDAKLSSMLDYFNFLPKKQTITHINSKGFSLRLTNYGPNPYYFSEK